MSEVLLTLCRPATARFGELRYGILQPWQHHRALYYIHSSYLICFGLIRAQADQVDNYNDNKIERDAIHAKWSVQELLDKAHVQTVADDVRSLT